MHSASAAEPDDPHGDESAGSEEAMTVDVNAPIVEVQAGLPVQTVEDRDVIMETENLPNQNQDNETFNITHRSAIDGSILAAAPTPGGATVGISPAAPNPTPTFASPIPSDAYPSFTRALPAAPGILAARPRDEDVLMSLQLLAYVSKYCNLRTYFQKTHLVPMLKIDRDLAAYENGTEVDTPIPEGDEWEEYLQPNNFNIFPLVEKFTVRHHSQDMQYWACVVMRNLCRKDDSKGGIRQCAYYECGKWEEYTRQFAKCRRCRRTKYCSKECQKSAWVYHRHWCNAPS
ncbi:putative mynd domain protein [Phaeomoniella chlamydospora]|uniref:MYND-type zinc finger protein samB n=1 Tax=Phaeomoniella chlamydospora TaxID=158046 RepID=A0A0G2HHN6_PHACM|nr:putative mynd domain protein [Phaeomoniella chlamydospora]